MRSRKQKLLDIEIDVDYKNIQILHLTANVNCLESIIKALYNLPCHKSVWNIAANSLPYLTYMSTKLDLNYEIPIYAYS